MKAALSMAFTDLRGKAGPVVIARAKSGLVLRVRTNPHNPRTTAQQSIRANLSKAAAAYKNLAEEEAEAWQDYAQTLQKTNRITGQAYHPAAITAFIALASKVLQIDPEAEIPTTPPAQPFEGDDLQIQATPAPQGILFQASDSNKPGIKTELLIQPLPSRNRKPQPRNYRTKIFTTFKTNPTIPLPPGIYATAYRYTNPTTGQQTDLIQLGKIEVE